MLATFQLKEYLSIFPKMNLLSIDLKLCAVLPYCWYQEFWIWTRGNISKAASNHFLITFISLWSSKIFIDKMAYDSSSENWSTHIKVKVILVSENWVQVEITVWLIMNVSSIQNIIINTFVRPNHLPRKILMFLTFVYHSHFQHVLTMPNPKFISTVFCFYRMKWVVDFAVLVICSMHRTEVSGFSVRANKIFNPVPGIYPKWITFLQINHQYSKYPCMCLPSLWTPTCSYKIIGFHTVSVAQN